MKQVLMGSKMYFVCPCLDRLCAANAKLIYMYLKQGCGCWMCAVMLGEGGEEITFHF